MPLENKRQEQPEQNCQIFHRSLNFMVFIALKYLVNKEKAKCRINTTHIIAVPAGGAGGAIAPQVLKIWAKLRFFGQ